MPDRPWEDSDHAAGASLWAAEPAAAGASLGGIEAVPAAAPEGAGAGGLPEAQRMLFKERTVDLCDVLSRFETLRFNELQRKLGGISTRTLAGRLAALQTVGFVRRRVVRAIPPHVEYRLTSEGNAFLGLARPLYVYLRSMPAPQAAPPHARLDRRALPGLPGPRRPDAAPGLGPPPL